MPKATVIIQHVLPVTQVILSTLKPKNVIFAMAP